jgi:flagellar biosynthetic protein FliQ
MSPSQATDIVRETLMLAIYLSAPVLLAALVIGLVIGVLQAVTQIQEQTLTFVPKILGMIIVAILVTPWLIQMTMEFSARMFGGG